MDSLIIRLPYPFTIRTHHRPSSSSSSFISISHHYTQLFKLERTITSISNRGTSKDGVVFNEDAYEAERLILDAKARESMAETSKRVMEEEEDTGESNDPKAWKWKIRKRVWDLMEALNIAQNPRPVHHRIPNFVGAAAAADKASLFSLYICI